MIKQHMLETIEVLERLRDLRQLWLGQSDVDPIQEISLFLMKRHLTGQITTPSNLAHAAQVPYTTATRRIADMRASGLLEFRPRTQTGRSFSVHPSRKLIANMTSFLAATRDTMVGAQIRPSRKTSDPRSNDVIAMPSIARDGLGFSDGLHILVVNDPAYAIAKPLQRELNYLMGGRVRYSQASIDTLRAAILANAENAVSDYDIVAVDLPMIAEFALAGVLAPLDDIAADSHVNSADFVAAAWQGTIVDQRQYAIPILINPQLLFYRKDLLAAAGTPPPQTTQDVLHIARALHDPAQGRYGVSWTAALGAPLGQAFIQFLADFGQPIVALDRSVGGYNTQSGTGRAFTPMIDTDQGHATARFMTELLAVSAPQTLTMGWDGQVELLRQGQVAMAYEWASRATQLTGAASANDLGFLPHPTGIQAGKRRSQGRLAPIGGFAFGIPANIAPARRRIAWNAIEWLASPQVVKLLAQHGGYVTPRLSVAADADVQRLSPMIAAVEHMAKRGEISLWPRPPVARYAALVSILGDELHAMLRGEKSVALALKLAQQRADAI